MLKFDAQWSPTSQLMLQGFTIEGTLMNIIRVTMATDTSRAFTEAISRRCARPAQAGSRRKSHQNKCLTTCSTPYLPTASAIDARLQRAWTPLLAAAASGAPTWSLYPLSATLCPCPQQHLRMRRLRGHSVAYMRFAPPTAQLQALSCVPWQHLLAGGAAPQHAQGAA